jgi:hypothetical protein
MLFEIVLAVTAEDVSPSSLGRFHDRRGSEVFGRSGVKGSAQR